jgi:hypothetical protein
MNDEELVRIVWRLLSRYEANDAWRSEGVALSLSLSGERGRFACLRSSCIISVTARIGVLGADVDWVGEELTKNDEELVRIVWRLLSRYEANDAWRSEGFALSLSPSGE